MQYVRGKRLTLTAAKKKKKKKSKVTDDCLAKYKDFKLRRKFKWVTFKVDEDKSYQVAETEADKKKTVEDLIQALPEADCRFVVYEHEYTTKDGRKTDKLFFISWAPQPAATHIKMDYLTGRQAIRDICDGCFDISADRASDVKDGVLETRTQDSDDEDDNDESWMD